MLPNRNTLSATVDCPLDGRLRRNQVSPLYTPRSVRRSPFQSPTTGWSPALPYPTTTSATPADNELRKNQTPLRNTPGVSVPLPSQSPHTGTSPGLPYGNVTSATPVV